MSYTRPPFDSADATWQGAGPYTRPAANAADATWQPAGPAVVQALVSVPSPLGVPAVVAESLGVDAVLAMAAVPGPLGVPAVQVARVGQAVATVPSPLGAPAATAFAVPVVLAAIPSPLGVPVVDTIVHRYELVGVVRDQGVAVDRRVRAYLRSTGALVAEADTVAGAFRLEVGFAPAEHYLVPLDLDTEAADYAPPCANRVVSELVRDEVAA